MTMDLKDALDEAVNAALPVPSTAAPSVPAPVTEDEPDPADDTTELDPTAEGEPDASEEGEGDEPEGPAVPEGYVAPSAITEGLATQFVLYDEQGEVEVPNLMVKYQANGKERNDRLDQVVKMAQWGAYNQERDQRAKAIEQQYEEVATDRDSLQELLEEREAQLERLLQDDEFLAAAREAYDRENSPERRAERAEERVKAAQAQAQLAPIVAEGTRFYRGEVGPALARIHEVLPTVTMEELDQRMALAMQAHAEMGPHGQPIVTPAKYDALRQYIVEDLAVWAKAIHEYRSTGKVGAVTVKATPAAPDPELTRARREAQKAKNTMARAMKPSAGGVSTKESRRPAKAGTPATVDDALSDAMASVLQHIPR